MSPKTIYPSKDWTQEELRKYVKERSVGEVGGGPLKSSFTYDPETGLDTGRWTGFRPSVEDKRNLEFYAKKWGEERVQELFPSEWTYAQQAKLAGEYEQKELEMTGTKYLAVDEARDYGFTLEPGYELKAEFGETGETPRYSIISSGGWEFGDLQWDEEGQLIDYTATYPGMAKSYSMSEFEELMATPPIGATVEAEGEQYRRALEGYYPTERPVTLGRLSPGGYFRNVFNLPEESDVAPIEQWANTDTEGFIDVLKHMGRTPETEGLLASLGVEPEVINEIYPDEPEPTWWQKVLFSASNVLEKLFTPATTTGVQYKEMQKYLEAVPPQGLTESHKAYEERLASLGIEKPKMEFIAPWEEGWLEAQGLDKQSIETFKQTLPGGELYEEYQELPWTQQLKYELPFWGALTLVPGATQIRLALRPAATAGGFVERTAAQVGRAALAPIEYAIEKPIALGLKYGIGVPIKYAGKGIEAASRKAFEKALDTGLDKWLMRQAVLPDQSNKVIQYFIKKNDYWLYERATANWAKRQAERKGVEYTARMAAEDTIKEAEPLLLQAVKDVGTEVKPTIAKPSEFAVEKPFVREVPITPPPTTPEVVAPGVEKVIPEFTPMPLEVQREMLRRGEAELKLVPQGLREPNSIIPIRSGYVGTDASGNVVLAIQLSEGEGGALVAGNVVAKEDTPRFTIGKLLKKAEPLLREAGVQVPTEGLSVQGARLAERYKRGEEKVTPEVTLPEGVRGIAPAVEVTAPEAIEAKISDKQKNTLDKLAKDKLIMTEEGKAKPQLTHLMKGLVGKNKVNNLTTDEANIVIDALEQLEVKYGKPPKIPTTTALITGEFAEKIPHLKEIGILEKVRPTRKVFEKMGLETEIWKPAFEAETALYEERIAVEKEISGIEKLIGKNRERQRLVFREGENPGTQLALTYNERRALYRARKFFDKFADRLGIPEEKRRENYITHTFEADITQQLKEKHPLDPELIKAMDFVTPKTIFNPYLQKRLGQKIGLQEDIVKALRAYASRELKVIYYEPLIQKIRVYQKYLPPNAAKYLRDYITRITDRPLNIDKEMNQTLKEFSSRIEKLPGGKELSKFFNRGNPGGLAAYNFTSALYTLWLGFKPTSAIRNLSQHTLILAETGPQHFADGIRLRLTKEGKDALKDSLVLRSRTQAFLPAIDASFVAKRVDKIREAALWMFRQADKQNVSDAFLAGYSEAKSLLPDADRQVWIDRGDEVAADTQYLYTKLNSASWSQSALGRVFSMLTTWTENWIELTTKWVKGSPSKVYQQYEKTTGQTIPTKNWSSTRKAILMYMAIVGMAYVVKELTRLKAFEYTGVTSLNYLADVIGGEFPALEYPGAVMDVVAGFLLDDDRRLKTGWAELKPTNMAAIVRQIENVASGEKDWMTLLFYLEGRDYKLKQLKERWTKDVSGYTDIKLPEDTGDMTDEELSALNSKLAKQRKEFRQENPLVEAKLFVTNQLSTLSSDEARAEVLRLISEHKLDTELIDGYEKIFGTDTKELFNRSQKELGKVELTDEGEQKVKESGELDYFTTNNFASEVREQERIVGRYKLEKDGHPLVIEYLHAQDSFEPYNNIKEPEGRILYRQQFPDVEAQLYLWGQISAFENPKSADILLGLMDKYDIPPEAIPAFLDDPSKYDELFTRKFELEKKWFDLTSEYESYGNKESPNYIADPDERKAKREEIRADNPDWMADMRQVEAIEKGGEQYAELYADYGKVADEFGSNSPEAKLWKYEHPDFTNWAMENFDWQGTLGYKGMDYYKMQIKWRDTQAEYDELETDEERDKFLASHPDFRDDLRRMQALDMEMPEDFIETYVAYNRLPIAGYDREWFLIDNMAYYKEVYLKDHEPIALDKIPTKEVYNLYLQYEKLPSGKRRDDFRYEHLNLDKWLLKVGKVSVSILEKKRREHLTPLEEFAERVTGIKERL